MATFKAAVTDKKKDGTYNIKIRVTHNRVNKYIQTIYFVTKNELTRSLKIKDQYYIDETDKIIRRYRRKCDLLGEKLNLLLADELIKYLKKEELEGKDGKFDLDIVAYTKKLIQGLIDTD